MRYLLLICGDDAAHKAMAADGSFEASCHAWADELQRRGVLVSVQGLRSPGDATTVRVRGDEVLLPSRKRFSAGRATVFPAGPERG